MRASMLRNGMHIGADKLNKALDVTDVITVKNSLIVTLNVTSTVIGEPCGVGDPGYIDGQIFLTPPNGPEAPIITITAGDVTPEGSCVGVHTSTKSHSPLTGAIGIYKVRFHGYHANVIGSGWSFNFTPSVLIIADGNVVVKSPYPTLSGDGSADDSWEFSFEP